MSRSDGLTTAQSAALRRLVAEGTLSAADEDAVRLAFAHAAPVRRVPSGWLVEVAGYLGGALVLAAAGLFLSASWDTMTRPVRGWLLAGFAVALVVAGTVLGGGPAPARRLADGRAPARCRLVGLLYALACVPAGWAVGVSLGTHASPAGAAVAFVVALAGFLVLPTFFGIVAAMLTSWFALMSGIDDWQLTPLTVALLSLVLATAWYALAVAGRVGPRPVVFALGLAIALAGAQAPLSQDGAHPWAYGLTATISLACFLLYRWASHTVLLIGGIIAATIAVPEAVADLTNGALGGSAVLLTVGVVLLAVSALGLHLRSTGGTRRRPA
jgi:hypothetical protein